MIDLVLIGEGVALSKIVNYAENSNAFRLKIVFSDSLKKKIDGNYKTDGLKIFSGSKIHDLGTYNLLKNSLAKNCWLLSINNSKHLIPVKILELFEDRNLNAHIGLLPEYAGKFGHQWAMMNGETKTGVTLHLMNNFFDSGKIFSREDFFISESATGMSVLTECYNLASKMTEEFLDKLAKGKQPTPIEQTHFGERKAYRVSDMPDGKLNWNLKSSQLYDFVRAANYRPFKSPNYTPFLLDNNMNKIFVDRAFLQSTNKIHHSGTPGLVLSTDFTISVLCGDLKSLTLEIALESKNNLKSNDLEAGNILR